MALPSDNAITNGVSEETHLTDEDGPIDPLTASSRMIGRMANTRKHTKRGQLSQKKRMSNAQELVRERIVSPIIYLFYTVLLNVVET